MTALVVTELVSGTLEGAGVFDALMRAIKGNLEQEFIKGRIKGPEYSTVYLGSMQLAMQSALQFLLQQRKNDLEAQLLQKQIDNAIKEGEVLEAQKCKLQAEYDLTMATVLKANQETALLTQKVATEKAQIMEMGVDDNSVVGRQKALYVAQTNGFTRDAEQKAAKLLADTWSVRRTTDEATVADGTNMLNDVTIGRAINKLLTGVGA